MKKILGYVFISLLYITGCSKAELEEINNLNNNTIWVIGHAGEGFQTGRHPVPTNSEPSIVKAIEFHNADGCEVDVQLSKDSILILFHDDLLEKTTHCQGCVSEKESSELLDCKFKQDFAVNTLQNEKLITLERIFELYCHSIFDPKFIIDLKLSNDCGQNSPDYYQAVAKSLTDLIKKYNADRHILISCPNQDLLNMIRNIYPDLKLIYNIGAGDYDSGLKTAIENSFYGIEIYNHNISKDQVREVHANNLWVVIYGVKDRNSQVDAIKKSPDVIITDNIPLLQQILSE
jgi:glycerophosphoryl diester phosphodiesterase